jgi:hypothetical protein
MKTEPLTIRQLRNLLLEWQSILKLTTWTITLNYGTNKYMGGNVGLNVFSPEEEISNIYLRRGEGESTLVHELLHLVFDGHKAPEGQAYSTLHERAINRTAEALVAVKYAT